MPSLTFYGAAETVTGSNTCSRRSGAEVFIDCGLFQGLKDLRLRNWAALPIDVRKVQSVVLTHAHIDHIGFLPRMVKLGFRGPVHCTPATYDLANIMLYDAAKNQEEDADYANREHSSKHVPALPLYNSDDVSASLKLLEAQPRGRWFQAAGPIWCRYHNIGHLLGAAMIEVELHSADARCGLFSRATLAATTPLCITIRRSRRSATT